MSEVEMLRARVRVLEEALLGVSQQVKRMSPEVLAAHGDNISALVNRALAKGAPQ
jgi:hypothetical protein